MLNAIGLANVGLDRFLVEKVPLIQKMPCPVIVNVAGHSFDDYAETCGAMNDLDCIAAVELNVSCPNVKDGLTFGTHPGRLKELTAEVKKVLPRKPLIVKLSPNVEDITQTARATIEGGADLISMINTFTAMAIDIHKKRPRLANVTGGLSGPAIKPIALHLVSRVYRSVAKSAGVPIIGMGGIQFWSDALEFILAGASAVGVGTALFVDPAAPNKIRQEMLNYMHAHRHRKPRRINRNPPNPRRSAQVRTLPIASNFGIGSIYIVDLESPSRRASLRASLCKIGVTG